MQNKEVQTEKSFLANKKSETANSDNDNNEQTTPDCKQQ